MELEKVSPQLRAQPLALELRYEIYDSAGKWEMALGVAEGLMHLLPENQWGYFYTAYAVQPPAISERSWIGGSRSYCCLARSRFFAADWSFSHSHKSGEA